MKKYNLIYKAEVTVVVEASNDDEAIKKAQEETLKISEENKIFLSPIDTKFKLNKV